MSVKLNDRSDGNYPWIQMIVEHALNWPSGLVWWRLAKKEEEKKMKTKYTVNKSINQRLMSTVSWFFSFLLPLGALYTLSLSRPRRFSNAFQSSSTPMSVEFNFEGSVPRILCGNLTYALVRPAGSYKIRTRFSYYFEAITQWLDNLKALMLNELLLSFSINHAELVTLQNW